MINIRRIIIRELMGKAHPMSFMYDPPPGYKAEEDKVSGRIQGLQSSNFLKLLSSRQLALTIFHACI